MLRVLHRNLIGGRDCALPGRDLSVEHHGALNDVSALFPPCPDNRSAAVRALRETPRGRLAGRDGNAGSEVGPRGVAEGPGKSAGEHGSSEPLPSVEVRRIVRVSEAGNRVWQAGRSREVWAHRNAFGRTGAAGPTGGEGIVALVAVVLAAQFVRGV